MKKLVLLFLLTNFISGQQIKILSPQPSELIFKFDKNYPITWEGPSLSNVEIKFTSDNGDSWININGSGDLNQNYFYWDVSKTEASSGKILIYALADSSNRDTLDFKIIISDNDKEYISINNALMWISNDGFGSHDPRNEGSGFYWPKNEQITSVFNDGLLIGGKINGTLHVTGTTYRTGLKPGRVLNTGIADSSGKYQNKIFKIRKNWESIQEAFARLNYQNDYENWPGELGAPFEDIDNDGIYTKGIDKPKFVGDEVLFNLMNDLDTAQCRYLYGSDPMGLEFQLTTFAFTRNDILDNVVFKKYKIINKSQNTIDDVIISYWADDDLGFAGDDFIGCDSTLNLGYTWNSDNDDNDYYGMNPPAVGHMFLQTPAIPASGESANFDFGKKLNFKNLPMSSFTPILKNMMQYPHDATIGVYQGTIQSYFIMQGLNNSGDTMVSPITNKKTFFMLNGDPVSKTGWYEGEGWQGGPSASDRRHIINSGKFTMAPGDTQDVIIAIMMARGADNINSISELRRTAKSTKEFLESGFSPTFVVNAKDENSTLPTKFLLHQNYPNPFNPETIISYELPFSRNVTLKIFDILGREIATLVDEFQKPGIYNYTFQTIHHALSSGVYFYQLRAGEYSVTKKMILMK